MELTPVSNLLVTLNSSVNFIIYCIFGEKFKRLFCHLFCGRKWCCLAALANKDDFPLLQGGNSVPLKCIVALTKNSLKAALVKSNFYAMVGGLTM